MDSVTPDAIRMGTSRVAPRRLRLVISSLMVTAFAWAGLPVAATTNPAAGRVLVLGVSLALGLMSADLLRQHLAGRGVNPLKSGTCVVAGAFACGGSVLLAMLGLLCAAGVILGVAILRHARRAEPQVRATTVCPGRRERGVTR